MCKVLTGNLSGQIFFYNSGNLKILTKILKTYLFIPTTSNSSVRFAFFVLERRKL